MPTKEQQPLQQMVAIDSPEFRAAVAAAVARVAVAGAPAEHGNNNVVATSIDASRPGLDDLIVRFNRFSRFAGTAYQNGQEAWFPRSFKGLHELLAKGEAVVTYDPRLSSPEPRMRLGS